MFKIKLKKLPDKQATYLSNNAIAISQVFFGIFAATLFSKPLDFEKMFVLLSTMSWSGAFWLTGWIMQI